MSVAPMSAEELSGLSGKSLGPITEGKKSMKREQSFKIEDLKERTKRPSIATVIKEMDKDGDGEVTIEEVVSFVEKHRGDQKHHSKMMRFSFGILVCLLLSVLMNAVAMFYVVESSKEMKMGDGEGSSTLATMDGKTVNTESAKSFVGITDLPQMPIEYLESLAKVRYTTARSGLEASSIDRFTWKDANTMTLYLYDGAERIEIAADHSGEESDVVMRTATLYRSDGSTEDLPSAATGRRRRLAELGEHDEFTRPQVYSSHAELRAAVAAAKREDPELHHRMLSTGTDVLFEVYAFFGGIAEGSISKDTINRAEGVPDAEDSVLVMPLIPTISKWDLVTYDAETDSPVPGTWYLDTSSAEPKFRIETLIGEGTLLIEEVFDGLTHTYQSADAAALIAALATSDATETAKMCPDADVLEASDTTCEAFVSAMLATTAEAIELNAGRKEACTVTPESADQAAALAAAATATVTADYGDGSGVFSVGGWFIKTDTAGTPIEFVDGESFNEVVATISTISAVTSADGLFDGCSEGEDDEFLSVAEDLGRRRQLRAEDTAMPDVQRKAHDLVDAVMAAQFHTDWPVEEMIAPHLIEAAGGEDGRRLSATAFQAWASGTQWCGAGTDLVNTPCPLTQVDDGDMACHRHDHGKKANGIIGGMAVRLGCDIDRGLAERTSNWAAQAIFGSWGIAQTWGCYDTGSYSCWDWKSKWWGGYWRYGGYCSGEHTHYGPWRYSSYSHSYGWNSQSRCATKFQFCTGCI